MRKKTFTRTLLGAGLALSLLGVAACGGSPQDPDQEPQSSEQQSSEQQAGSEQPGSEQPGSEQSGSAQTPEQPEMPQPDLDDVPEVVAEVNGEEITRDEFVTAYEGQFQQLALQAQMSGQDVDQDQLKQQTAESLVSTELLIQEADRRGISASDDQIDSTLQELAEASQLESGDELIAALGEQGVDEDEVRAQLETQVKLDQLVAEEAGDIMPTEEELRELYDQAIAQQEQAGGEAAGEVPPFEEVRPQLEEQAVAQQEGEAVQALLGDLREDADISINL